MLVPRVRPLGTQPDQRDLETRVMIRGRMERNGVSSMSELGRMTSMSDKTIKERLSHPADMKVGELRTLVDKLNIPESDLLKVFYE